MKTGFALAVACLIVASATLALAGANPHHKVAAHVQLLLASCNDPHYPTFSNCSDILTTYASDCTWADEIAVFPVFFDLVEYSAVEFGFTWPSDWISGMWLTCRGDRKIGDILWPGDGVTIKWNTCQTGWYAAPGYLWLIASSSGYVETVPYPATGRLGVIDCQPSPGPYFDASECVYRAGVCAAHGASPCLPSDTEGTTWGKIKSAIK